MKVEIEKFEKKAKFNINKYIGNTNLDEEHNKKSCELFKEIRNIQDKIQKVANVEELKELQKKENKLKDEYYALDLEFQRNEDLVYRAEKIIEKLEKNIQNIQEDKYMIEELVEQENIGCENYVPLQKFVAESDIQIIQSKIFQQSIYDTSSLIDIDDFYYFIKDVDTYYYVEPVIDYRCLDKIIITDFKITPLFLAKDLWKISKIKEDSYNG